MKRNIFGLGMLVLVFGMIVVGCGGSLNGTWVFEDPGLEAVGVSAEYKFSNGRFEYLQNGDTRWEGTYTTRGNSLTFFGDKDPDTSESCTYSVRGNTLTLTLTDGDSGSFTLTKKQESKPKGGGGSISKIKEKDLVGVWELEDVENIPRREASDRDEYFKDGTAIMSQGSQSMSLTWRLRDGNRLQLDTGNMETQICVIELSEKGRLLTYYYDDEHQKKAMYRKK